MSSKGLASSPSTELQSNINLASKYSYEKQPSEIPAYLQTISPAPSPPPRSPWECIQFGAFFVCLLFLLRALSGFGYPDSALSLSQAPTGPPSSNPPDVISLSSSTSSMLEDPVTASPPAEAPVFYDPRQHEFEIYFVDTPSPMSNDQTDKTDEQDRARPATRTHGSGRCRSNWSTGC